MIDTTLKRFASRITALLARSARWRALALQITIGLVGLMALALLSIGLAGAQEGSTSLILSVYRSNHLIALAFFAAVAWGLTHAGLQLLIGEGPDWLRRRLALWSDVVFCMAVGAAIFGLALWNLGVIYSRA